MTAHIPENPPHGDAGKHALGADITALPTLPALLRAARHSKGLAVDVCAQNLRLPVRILRQLEQGGYEGIDHHVYLGSYLLKYGRYLGIDESLIQAELQSLRRVEPPLVATGGISHSRYLLERYATAGTYAVLTAVIVVPIIWLGLSGTLDHDGAHLAPLDAAPVAQQEVAPVGATSGTAKLAIAPSKPTAMSNVTTPVDNNPQPLVASMMPNLDNGTVQPVAAPSVEATQPIGSGAHELGLDLANPSWVEVTDKSGTRLEYGLLQAGNKVFHSDQSLDVRIGNASDAQVTLDGQPVKLDAYRHSNVAHFHVVIQDGKAETSGSL